MVIATIGIGVLLFSPLEAPDSTPDAFSGDNTDNDSDEQYLPINSEVRQTLMGVDTSGPPPWPNGNYLSLIFRQNYLGVTNMSAENYERAIQEFNLDNVKVKIIENNYAVVIDPRIPKSWLMGGSLPGMTPEEVVAHLKRKRAEAVKGP